MTERIIQVQKNKACQDDILLNRNLTDAMKFISCLMVAFGHYSGYVLANGLSSHIIYKAIAATGGYLGVAIFFFLSGYGLMKSDQKHHLGGVKFFQRRLLKTYLPAVLVSALWLGFASMTSMDLLCNKQYFLGVVWRFNDEVMWFVKSIIIMYVTFRAYLMTSSRITYRYQWLVLTTVCILTYSGLRYFNIGSTLSVPLFFGGVAVAQYGKQICLIFRNVWMVAALTLVAIALLWLFRHDNYLLHGWGNYVTMGVLLWIFCRWNVVLIALPKWVGACSYDIYLVHHKVMLALVYFLGVDLLWTFVLGTTIVTVVFYKFRNVISV